MPPIVLDGTTGITTPGLTNTGTETVVNLTTTGNTILGDASTDTLNVGNGGLVKDASGNVGIGTASPGSNRLFVEHTGAQVSSFNSTAANGGYMTWQTSGTAIADLGTAVNCFGTGGADTFAINGRGARALLLGTNNTERMRIDSSGNVLVTSAASLGYGTGSGGSVTQATSKGTGVTINKANGRITMNNAALGAGGTVVFLVSNSLVASTDTVVINVNDGVRGDLYNVWVWYLISGGFYVALKNIGGSSYSDAVVLNFSVIKATTS